MVLINGKTIRVPLWLASFTDHHVSAVHEAANLLPCHLSLGAPSGSSASLAQCRPGALPTSCPRWIPAVLRFLLQLCHIHCMNVSLSLGVYFHWCQHQWKKKHLWASLVAQMVKSLPAYGRPGFHPWVRRIPWRREWQPTPVFLPGKSHGERSLEGYSLWGHRELDT